MLAGFMLQARPAGENVGVKATVPVNPLSGTVVIDEVATAFARAETLVGLAEMPKSGDALDWWSLHPVSG